MILHIATDEKFIDMAIRSFEDVAPLQNDLFILTNEDSLKHVKYANSKIVKPQNALSTEFINSLSRYEFVVLHSLTQTHMQIVAKAAQDVKFLWVGWGYDYYGRFDDGEKHLFLPSTLALYKKNKSCYQLFRSKLSLLKHLLMGTSNLFKKTLPRIDFFAPVLPNEYELCRNNFKNLRAKFIHWNYGNIEQDLSVPELSIEGNNILLGNSASYTNNHLEAITSLQNLGAQLPEKIIVPLSYGNPTYQDHIISAGRSQLGQKFTPLTDFVKPEQYWRTIASCRYVFMNHLRQQAMGNIVMMMNLGASIFLNPKNPAYTFFVDRGAHLFKTTDLSTTSNISHFNLSHQQIKENREILLSHWGKNIILQRTRDLINEITLSPKLA